MKLSKQDETAIKASEISPSSQDKGIAKCSQFTKLNTIKSNGDAHRVFPAITFCRKLSSRLSIIDNNFCDFKVSLVWAKDHVYLIFKSGSTLKIWWNKIFKNSSGSEKKKDSFIRVSKQRQPKK